MKHPSSRRHPTDELFYTVIESPLDPLLLLSNGEQLTGVYMDSQQHRPASHPDWRRQDAMFKEASSQFRAYFAGEMTRFELPLAMAGTEFQCTVWRGLLGIPFGHTVSYGELARRIDHPRAVRAVGLANGRNPLAIVVPCHRVIGSNGSLTGYAGGLSRKRWLLQHEGIALPTT